VSRRRRRSQRVLVIYCHPLADSFVAEVHRRAQAGLSAGGHEVRTSDLYAEGFRPELSVGEHTHHLDPPDRTPGTDDLTAHFDNLRWCDHLVLVYPTWWSGQPAMLKGWIDRVWAYGVAFDLPAGAARITPLLGNIRTITAITAHGSTKLTNIIEGESGKRVVTRSIRLLCSRRCTTRWIAFYGVDRSSQTARTAFLDRVERRMRR
jgi:NAD(P)H dehydrogenase (quinone)